MTSPRIVRSRLPARQVDQRAHREPVWIRGSRQLDTRAREGSFTAPWITDIPPLAPGFGQLRVSGVRHPQRRRTVAGWLAGEESR